ncbi:MAG: D-aminoacyl-tRNA deacylase [Eubacteriales bacterium]|nr:D-aminoacyl-tRNA deacylase [Eubacteriales bacterium]
MKLVIQRAQNAKVEVNNKLIGEIKKGYVVLLGVGHNDTTQTADYLVKKLVNLRIFTDEDYKMNLSIKDVKGELLIISQFTLYADSQKGNRPSFVNAASPDKANKLYEYFKQKCSEEGINVASGIFGEHMKVTLTNDGPVTIILEKN